MGHVSNKAVVAQNIPREAVRERGRALLDPAAVATDEVDVVGMLGQVIARRPVVEMGVADHGQLLERLERAIDRGGRQGRAAVGGHGRDDLLRCRVSQPSDSVQDSLPLRRHPATTRSELLADVVHHPTLRSLSMIRTGHPYTDGVLDTFEETPTRPSRSRGSRVRRALAAALALLLVLVVGVVAAYLLFLNHTLTTNVKHQSLLPTPGVSGAAAPPARKAAAGNAQNILIIGSDSRSTTVAEGRSDVIVLMHVAADRKTVTLVHFPRDLYVSVPGHGKDKINAAFAYGGAPLLVQTLQDLIGVPIDHVAVLGFDGFQRMTDAVGGVDVYVEETGSSTEYTYHKGYQHMDGAEALAFVRERHSLSEGDISRGRRQQAFIKALLLKSLSRSVLTNPITLAHFVDAGTKNLTVDNAFSISDMRSEAFSMRNLRSSDIAFVTAPFTGFGTAPNGGSIDIVDEPGMQSLGQALQNDQMNTYADQTHTP